MANQKDSFPNKLGWIVIGGIVFRYGINFADFIYSKMNVSINQKFIAKNMKIQQEINDINIEEQKKQSYVDAEFPIKTESQYTGNAGEDIAQAMSTLENYGIHIDMQDGEFGDDELDEE